MINRLMEKKRQEEGFTLIELLIVVIILGILAAVVVFGVSTFRSDSVKNACQTDMKSVETAAQAYKAKTGAYPVGDDSAERIAVLTAGADPYLKSAPNSTDYTVTLAANGAVTGNTTATGTPAC